MEDLENARAQKEAVETASKATASANRARLWAGLNRYLAAEADHARKAAREEAKAKAAKAEKREEDRR